MRQAAVAPRRVPSVTFRAAGSWLLRAAKAAPAALWALLGLIVAGLAAFLTGRRSGRLDEQADKAEDGAKDRGRENKGLEDEFTRAGARKDDAEVTRLLKRATRRANERRGRG